MKSLPWPTGSREGDGFVLSASGAVVTGHAELQGDHMKAIPRVVQLPGGIRLTGVRFKVTAYDEQGAPRAFEILPPDAPQSCHGRVWVLFADEVAIRSPVAPEDQ